MNIDYQLYFNNPDAKKYIQLILEETDNDFIPKISSKFELSKIVDKYSRLAYNLIVFVDESPAGLVSFYINTHPDNSYLSIICVRKEFRGMQLGLELEKRCIQTCKNYKSSGLKLNMRKSNTRLLESRLSMGYKITKEYEDINSSQALVDLHMSF